MRTLRVLHVEQPTFRHISQLGHSGDLRTYIRMIVLGRSEQLSRRTYLRDVLAGRARDDAEPLAVLKLCDHSFPPVSSNILRATAGASLCGIRPYRRSTGESPHSRRYGAISV